MTRPELWRRFVGYHDFIWLPISGRAEDARPVWPMTGRPVALMAPTIEAETWSSALISPPTLRRDDVPGQHNSRRGVKSEANYPRQDSNLEPSAPEADTLSN